MNKLLIALMLTVTATGAFAQAQCSMIGNDDSRHYCEAKISNNAGRCGAINNDDKRHYCEAVVRRDPNRCNTINNDDQRSMCKAESR